MASEVTSFTPRRVHDLNVEELLQESAVPGEFARAIEDHANRMWTALEQRNNRFINAYVTQINSSTPAASSCTKLCELARTLQHMAPHDMPSPKTTQDYEKMLSENPALMRTLEQVIPGDQVAMQAEPTEAAADDTQRHDEFLFGWATPTIGDATERGDLASVQRILAEHPGMAIDLLTTVAAEAVRHDQEALLRLALADPRFTDEAVIATSRIRITLLNPEAEAEVPDDESRQIIIGPVRTMMLRIAAKCAAPSEEELAQNQDIAGVSIPRRRGLIELIRTHQHADDSVRQACDMALARLQA
ncbi:MAG: hypothetical protein RL235_986 [Chlamydiota bacterium]|jgi:hypothetical protein